MSLAKKQFHPANDVHGYAKVPYATLPRAQWNYYRLGAFALLAVVAFLVALGLAFALHALFSVKPPAPVQMAVTPAAATISITAPAAPASQPYDLTINASELIPQSALGPAPEHATAELLPLPIEAHTHTLAPILEITVAEDSRAAPAPQQNTAALKVSSAEKFASEGDLHQALLLQHNAVERDPDNMLYRLGLAVLYDKSNQGLSALTLYRQVISAFDNEDPSLPRTLSIENIRQRAAWLASKGS